MQNELPLYGFDDDLAAVDDAALSRLLQRDSGNHLDRVHSAPAETPVSFRPSPPSRLVHIRRSTRSSRPPARLQLTTPPVRRLLSRSDIHPVVSERWLTRPEFLSPGAVDVPLRWDRDWIGLSDPEDLSNQQLIEFLSPGFEPTPPVFRTPAAAIQTRPLPPQSPSPSPIRRSTSFSETANQSPRGLSAIQIQLVADTICPPPPSGLPARAVSIDPLFDQIVSLTSPAIHVPLSLRDFAHLSPPPPPPPSLSPPSHSSLQSDPPALQNVTSEEEEVDLLDQEEGEAEGALRAELILAAAYTSAEPEPDEEADSNLGEERRGELSPPNRPSEGREQSQGSAEPPAAPDTRAEPEISEGGVDRLTDESRGGEHPLDQSSGGEDSFVSLGEDAEPEPPRVDPEQINMNNQAETKRLRLLVKRGILAAGDEYNEFDFDSIGLEPLRKVVEEAGGHKANLNEAIPYLEEELGEEDQLVRNGQAALKLTIGFIKEAHRRLNAAPPEPVRPPEARASPPPTVRKTFLKKKVQEQEVRVVADLEQLTAEFKSLSLSSRSLTDREFAVLEGRVQMVSKRSESIVKDGVSLTDHALEAGLPRAADTLDQRVVDLKEARQECELMVSEVKVDLRAFGENVKLAEIKPPAFSGDPDSGLDYYTFRKEYDEYSQSKSYSRLQQLRILKKTCLIGSAKALCADLQEVDEIMDFLKKHYGSPRVLLEKKILEFKTLGNCPSGAAKRRTWLIAAAQKLRAALKLAETHGIEQNLYFSALIPEVRLCLPYKLEEKFKEELEDTGTDCSDHGEMYGAMVRFMNHLVEKSAFDVNYEMVFQPRQLQSQARGGSSSQVKLPPPPPPQGRKTYPVRPVDVDQPADDHDGVEVLDSLPSVAASYTAAAEVKCVICKKKHYYLFQCVKFQETKIRERNRLTRSTRACVRCLRMDAATDLYNREAWWPSHKDNCEDKWICMEGDCSNAPPSKQFHFTMCYRHVPLNKDRVDEFIKGVDQGLSLKLGTRFFYNELLTFSNVPLETTDPPPPPPFWKFGSC